MSKQTRLSVRQFPLARCLIHPATATRKLQWWLASEHARLKVQHSKVTFWYRLKKLPKRCVKCVTQYADVVLFAKVVLIVAIILAASLGLFMRVRAWQRRKRAERARWESELERDLRDL